MQLFWLGFIKSEIYNLFYYIHFYMYVDKRKSKNIMEQKGQLLVLTRRIMESINSYVLLKR